MNRKSKLAAAAVAVDAARINAMIDAAAAVPGPIGDAARRAAAARDAAAVPPTPPTPPTPHCDACDAHASNSRNTRRADGHVYRDDATVPECNADVATDRAVNDADRAARAALPADASDADRARANAAVKRSGDRVWRTRNPGGHGGTVATPRAARRNDTVPTPPTPPVYYNAAIELADRLTANGVPTDAVDVANVVMAHVADYVAALNVGAIYAATLAARRDAINAAINAATA